MKDKLTIGHEGWYIPSQWERNATSRKCFVSRIGRKWFYTKFERSNLEQKFDFEGREVVNYGSGGAFYLSKQAYDEFLRKIALADEIRGLVDKDFSLEALENILKLVKAEL